MARIGQGLSLNMIILGVIIFVAIIVGGLLISGGECSNDSCCARKNLGTPHISCEGHWEVFNDREGADCIFVCDTEPDTPCEGGVAIKACPKNDGMVTCDILNNVEMCKSIDWEKRICILQDVYTVPGGIDDKVYQEGAEIWCK